MDKTSSAIFKKEKKSEMKLGSKIFLKQIYREYYFTHCEQIRQIIEEPYRREFGYINFEENALIRHLSFQDGSMINDFLIKNAPKNFYCSSAQYLFPEREMNEKE